MIRSKTPRPTGDWLDRRPSRRTCLSPRFPLRLLLTALALLCLAAPRASAVLVLVGVGPQGQGAGQCLECLITRDGTRVFFTTTTALTPDDTNGVADVYMRDLVTGAVQRVSLDSSGGQLGNSGSDPQCHLGGASQDGRYVTIGSLSSLDTGAFLGTFSWYRKDILTGAVQAIGPAPDQNLQRECSAPLSGDGSCVLFAADTGPEALPDYPTGLTNIYAEDLSASAPTPECISVGPHGEPSDFYALPQDVNLSLSADGRYVAFSSGASDLVPDVGITTGQQEVYLRDRTTETTQVVSVTPSGAPCPQNAGGPRLSSEGRYVAFSSSDTTLDPDDGGLTNVYVWDRLTAPGQLERVSRGSSDQPDYGCWAAAAVSVGGRYVLFESLADNLVPGCKPDALGYPYLLLRDRQSGTTISVITDLSGDPGNMLPTMDPYVCGPGVSMSDDGQLAVFLSAPGESLVPGGGDGYDVILWDPAARFYDLPSREWAFSAIEACVKAGIVGGYPDGTYHPLEVVNRAQMAVFIAGPWPEAIPRSPRARPRPISPTSLRAIGPTSTSSTPTRITSSPATPTAMSPIPTSLATRWPSSSPALS